MSSPFRYDWLGSLARIQEAGETPASFCLYCLPKAGVLLLNSLLERARWQATFRGFGYELTESEWLALTDIVDDTEVGLMANCDTVVASIVNQVTTNVLTQMIVNQAVADICCYEDQTGAPVNPPPPSETPPGTTDDRGERCARTQAAMDAGEEFLNQALTYAEAGGSITAGVIATILLGLLNPITFPVALLGLLVAAIVAIALQDIRTQVLTQWAGLTSAIACCMTWADTAEQAKDCIDSEIDSAVEDGTIASMFKFIWNQDQVNKVWEGAAGYSGAGYDPSFCDACITGTAIGIRFVIDEFWTDQSEPAGAGWTWANEETGDLIRGANRVDWSDIDDEGERPKTVFIYDERELSDPTTAPDYAASWHTQSGSDGGFDAERTSGRIRIGLQTKSSGATFSWFAETSGYRVLIREINDTMRWVTASLAEVEGVSGATVGAHSINYAQQEYTPGNLTNTVVVDMTWPNM